MRPIYISVSAHYQYSERLFSGERNHEAAYAFFAPHLRESSRVRSAPPLADIDGQMSCRRKPPSTKFC